MLPNALLRRFPLAVAAERAEVWKELWPLVLQFLYCGEVIVTRALRVATEPEEPQGVMMGETFEDASDWIA